jgi:hypothetical protein
MCSNTRTTTERRKKKSAHESCVKHIIRRNSHKPFYGDIVSKGEIVDNSYKVGCYERRSGVLCENPVSNKTEGGWKARLRGEISPGCDSDSFPLAVTVNRFRQVKSNSSRERVSFSLSQHSRAAHYPRQWCETLMSSVRRSEANLIWLLVVLGSAMDRRTLNTH